MLGVDNVPSFILERETLTAGGTGHVGESSDSYYPPQHNDTGDR